MKRIISFVLLVTMLSTLLCSCQKVKPPIIEGDNNINPPGTESEATQDESSRDPREELTEPEDFLSHPDMEFSDAPDTSNDIGQLGFFDVIKQNLPIFGQLLPKFLPTLLQSMQMEVQNATWIEDKGFVEASMIFMDGPATLRIKPTQTMEDISSFQSVDWVNIIGNTDSAMSQLCKARYKKDADKVYLNGTCFMQSMGCLISIDIVTTEETFDAVSAPLFRYVFDSVKDSILPDNYNIITETEFKTYLNNKCTLRAAEGDYCIYIWDKVNLVGQSIMPYKGSTLYVKVKESDVMSEISGARSDWSDCTSITVENLMSGLPGTIRIDEHATSIICFDEEKGITYLVEWLDKNNTTEDILAIIPQIFQ